MKFSIITVNYNNNKGLKKTIVSVLAQTCLDYEYIIIDGGSCDGSKETIEQHADKIDYWVSEPDKGIYNAMNKAIKVAKGDYLIFMNSGDCFFDDSVLKKVTSMMHSDADFIAGNTQCKGRINETPQEITATFMFKSTLCHQSVFIKRNAFDKEQYIEQYIITADWVHMFNALVLNNAKYQHLDTNISIIEEDGLSMKNWKQLEMERDDYLRKILSFRIYEDFSNFEYAKALSGDNQQLFKTLSEHHFMSNEVKFVNFLLKILIKFKKMIH